jgi:hypothetical protein
MVYADVSSEETSSASTIASTGQQMSISFAVATASLVTAVFVPDRFHATRDEMIHGLHQAFLLLGVLAMFSAVVFTSLRTSDGDAVSRHKEAVAAE